MVTATTRQSPLSAIVNSQWSIALQALVVTGLYLLLHPYVGVTHDARLYSLQALNHLRPDLYGSDIFLRYGSQDDYTFFTPLYAATISWLGVERAAALLTFVSQTVFLAAAAFLARKLMPAKLILVALGLLLLLPNHYGSQRVFSYLGGFLTPRLLAEGLTLFAIASWLGKRYLASAALLLCAMLTHPIMGLSGLVLVATISFPWRRYWPLALLALSAAALLALVGAIPAHWRIDDEWLRIVLDHAEYLMLGTWSLDDWGRVAIVAATLTIAALSLRNDPRRLSIGMLFSGCGLMLLALIGGDLLHVSIVVQAQPWRVLWLATVIAILLLPPIFIRCWHATPLHRCAMLLLAAAWLSPSENLALLFGPLAVATVVWSKSPISERGLRWLLFSSYVLLAIILIDALAVSLLTLQVGAYNIAVSPVLDALRSASTGGEIPLICFFVCYWIVRWKPRPALPIFTIIAGLLVTATVGPTIGTWLDIRYDDDLKGAFAEWRSHIPPGSDVMWAADTAPAADRATTIWLLLERSSYVSRIQATTSLFSRQAALEINRRTESLRGLLPAIESLYANNGQVTRPASFTLAAVCRSSTVRYIVTQTAFTDATPIPAPARIRTPFRNLKLYICP